LLVINVIICYYLFVIPFHCWLLVAS